MGLIICRYIDGLIRNRYLHFDLDFTWCPLRRQYDPELVEFFEGFEYRHDIVDRIDQEVDRGIQRLKFGGSVPSRLLKLISYCVWGNPVDTYKFFEYTYQREYLPHRYVPEHVVLGQIPKFEDYTEPQPSMTGTWMRYGYIRYRMARARDQDVGKVHTTLLCLSRYYRKQS